MQRKVHIGQISLTVDCRLLRDNRVVGNDGDFRLDKLGRRAGIGKRPAHQIVKRPLLGTAALEQRF
jgi:hypothetical protein